MATYNFELNHKPNRRGNFSVLLRITENKKHKRIKTPVELPNPKLWNSNLQEVRKNTPDFRVLNETLKRIKESAIEAEELLEAKNIGISSSQVISTMKAKRKTFSFLDFAEDYANKTNEAGRYITATKYITFINKLKLFINGVKVEDIIKLSKGPEFTNFVSQLNKDLGMCEITLSFLNKFKAYLQKLPNSRDKGQTLHPNTISKQFDIFQSLYNKASLEYKEEGFESKENPFSSFICETIDTNKEKLTEEEIRLLNELTLKEGSLLWHTRNCFMLAFYCAGIRAGDLLQLRGTNIYLEGETWRLIYRMDKTTTSKDILLIPEAINILSKYIDFNNRTTDYIFPLLDNYAPFANAVTWEEKESLPAKTKELLYKQISSKNSILNNNLSILAKKAGITKKISMHIARHSFANIARQKNANVYDISKALGHSSLKITEAYLSKFDKASQDATIMQVFAPTEDTKETLIKKLQHLTFEELSSLLKQVEK